MEKQIRATYKDSGVDIEAGEQAVDLIKEKVKETFQYFPGKILTDLGSFCGVGELKDGRIIGYGTDGVGTKLMLAQILNRHNTVGVDLVAMCVNDIIVHGIIPAFFLDYIAMGKQIPEKTDQIVQGIIEGCKMAEVALVGGEMAEMPGMYSPDEYDMAGFAVGFTDSRKNLILGSNIKHDMHVYGLFSSGVHSNGFTLIRKVFGIDFEQIDSTLDVLNDHYLFSENTLGFELLRHTRIYVRYVKALLQEVEIAGLAHITGGGLIKNPARILPKNCSMEIDLSSWEMPNIFKLIKDKGNVSLQEMLSTFNCGIGMIVVSPDENAGDVKIGTIREGVSGINFKYQGQTMSKKDLEEI